ncbi:carboxylating nicotinate-nucleotide diphosphorylase [Lacticaseibacillus camelliae]|uniref:Probable nicotinate-nucleotide pyrophosphorylase [carboxylating] n=1 Tax=Lacticaseibacillus camelliae DSM 22697 = JCM 13995 TaxID=1423730 RepID=A0A0R2F4D6_9LACO|nr:carboxylating nicotinate-nucleotide diphosphorylase [Lacticaseibacillus camelliae]KRN23314.1 nicotinate-nucleotide diphosphorylase [Lacticaseibacillus camelliae DSM 22697 = JCM 13995]
MGLDFERVAKPLTRFIDEDLGTGDLTAPLLGERTATGSFLAKTAGILSGSQIPDFLYRLLGHHVTYTPLIADGEKLEEGTIIARVEGSMADILAAERLSLNLMQRMSGIATATAQAVATLADPSINLLDTRKTAPGLRVFDKYAVRCGGGINHRFGLYDLAMLKDNHWAAFGDLGTAITQLRRAIGPTKMIEVEVETHAELLAAIAAQADIIMFDNQTPQTVRAWQALVPDTIQTEVSGGITLANLHAYAGSGVTSLSLGYLTNSVTNLDISFNLD